MKILKEGKLPTKFVINKTCHECNTEFEFFRYECVMETYSGKRENFIVCPLEGCNTRIKVEEWKETQK